MDAIKYHEILESYMLPVKSNATTNTNKIVLNLFDNVRN